MIRSISLSYWSDGVSAGKVFGELDKEKSVFNGRSRYSIS
jgi:hypothetical protein